MKKFLFLIIFFVGLIFPSFGQQASSLLWEIKKPGLKHKTYLYGTIHIISKKYYYFPKSLEDKIKKSKQVVLEIVDMEENKMEILPFIMLPEGQQMKDFFTPEQYDTLLQHVEKKLGLNKTLFEMSMGKMKPFFIMQLLAMDLNMSETESYDMNINKLAKTNKKTSLIGLETALEQIRFFDSIPFENMGEMIMEQIRKSDNSENMFEQMQAIYATQNLDSLYNFAYGEMESMENKSFEEILLIKRNENWIPKIKQLIHLQPTFIAVGAMHLGGKDGLIELLRKEGYEVNPVKF